MNMKKEDLMYNYIHDSDVYLYQRKDMFRMNTDTALLAHFMRVESDDVILDIGTNNAALLCYAALSKPKMMYGVDVLKEACELADFNLKDRGIPYQIICDDICNVILHDIDVIVCNPPYFTKGGAIPNNKKEKFIARHETTAVFEDFVKTAASILKGKGDFFIVHRPSRLVDIFYYCRKHKLEPKTMRMVAPKAGEAPNIVLIHCSAGGGKELKNLSTLYVYNSDGTYTEDIERIYERK